MAYAVAYPFGIFGILLTMILLRSFFKIDIAKEVAAIEGQAKSEPVKELSGFTATYLVTNVKAIKRVEDLVLPGGVEIIKIQRQGHDLAIEPKCKIRLEDRITVHSNSESSVKQVEKILGNCPKDLNHPQVLPIFFAIFIGVFVGSIPVAVPNLPTGVKLGVAGGSLIAAIVFSRIHRMWGMTWYMTGGANLIIREVGILLFLACVGLHAGTGFVETVVHGPGLRWMAMGTLITFVPLIIAALFMRLFWKIDYPAICGTLAGSMTDPPALAFSMQYLSSDLPASGYATVYPLTMILRILMGQLLVLTMFAG